MIFVEKILFSISESFLKSLISLKIFLTAYGFLKSWMSLIATFLPVYLFLALITVPNEPYPNFLMKAYYLKIGSQIIGKFTVSIFNIFIKFKQKVEYNYI